MFIDSNNILNLMVHLHHVGYDTSRAYKPAYTLPMLCDLAPLPRDRKLSGSGSTLGSAQRISRMIRGVRRSLPEPSFYFCILESIPLLLLHILRPQLIRLKKYMSYLETRSPYHEQYPVSIRTPPSLAHLPPSHYPQRLLQKLVQDLPSS